MNKIAVVSMVKNEQDIIESFVRHSMLFADKLYICDHKSSDETRQILEQLSNEFDIEISIFDKDEFAQAKIINELAHQAIDDGFDLIIPLDVDEFPIYINGSSVDLRQHFQNFDINSAKYTLCWEHRFTDDSENYALSRPVVKFKTITGPPKVIVGKNFYLQNNLHITGGNHSLAYPNDVEIFNPFNTDASDLVKRDDKIYYIHFSQRSPEQKISKYLATWLAMSMQFTRYTFFSYGCHNFRDEYFKNESVANIDLTDYIPTDDVEPYKNECVLTFNSGGGGYQSKSCQKYL